MNAIVFFLFFFSRCGWCAGMGYNEIKPKQKTIRVRNGGKNTKIHFVVDSTKKKLLASSGR